MKSLWRWCFLFGIAAIVSGMLVQKGFAQGGLKGDPIAGGRLYDNWYNELDIPPPEGNHPLWKTQEANVLSGAKTWRCQECHGWDYKGKDGAYASGEHYTGFRGVQGVIGKSHAEIIHWLDGTNNPDHNFGLYMEQADLDNLVAFLRTKQVDVALLVDYKTREALGIKRKGERLYNQNCVLCHGDDGRQRNFASASAPVYLGDVAVSDPWRAVHKIRFGQPASGMPVGEELGLTLQEVADLLAYMQSLPITQEESLFETDEEFIRDAYLAEQGDIRPIIIGAVALLLLLLSGVGSLTLLSRRT